MPEIVAPEDLEQLTEDDEFVLAEYVEQVNRKLRRHYRPESPCYIRLDPWPHPRIVNEILRMANERWNAEAEVSQRYSPYVLRFELKRTPDEGSSLRRKFV